MTVMTEPAETAQVAQNGGQAPADEVVDSEQDQKLGELDAIKALVSKDNPAVRRLYEAVDDDVSALQQYGRRAAHT